MIMESSRNNHSHLWDIGVSVTVVLFCSLIGMGIGYLMGASQQQREWSMLYCVAFIGAMSSFYCLIRIAHFSKLFQQGQVDIKKD
jgi:hypothetical protein